MIEKIKQWLRRKKNAPVTPPEQRLYTYDQLMKIAEDYGQVRYNEGKSDGLAMARQQATKSLKEILQWQNQTSPK